MVPTLLSLWRTLSGKAPQKGSSRRRRAGRRLLLEVLEDRAVPASLGWSTYIPGSVYATAVDSAGNIYVTGTTGSTFPTTPGAFQTSGSGMFVAKLNPAGTAVIYATYLGNGPGYNEVDAGTGIVVDSAGDAYVIGVNPNVPTTANAIASSSPGQVFVAELNPTGSALLYSTYLPGANNSGGPLGYSGAIAVDGSGDINVAGLAGPGLPVTANAYQTSYLARAGLSNAFYAKINPALTGASSLVYASYLGGSSTTLGDAATGIALDSSGNTYLTGYTSSTNFPTTPGALQRTFGGGTFDAFVAKFDPALSGSASLVYSTYLGGSGNDGCLFDDVNNGAFPGPVIDGGIAVDSDGDAYVTSATTSTDFPTTSGAFQVNSNLKKTKTFNGTPCDAIVAKLNATGTALIYSTYLGGGTNTLSGGAGVAVDASGDAYVTGWTNSTTFPTKNPLQAADSGGLDDFTTVLSPSGSGLLFSTYLGGGGDDYGMALALDSADNVYVAGQTNSSNFPTTAGAYQTTAGGGFLFKVTPVVAEGSFSVAGISSPTTAGASGTITVTARSATGSVLTGYTGTVYFSSSDRQAVLPAAYTFTAADKGVYTFTVTLKTAGPQTITVADETNGLLGSETGITVNPAAVSTFSITGFPSPTNAGLPGTITVTALDPYGNVATGYTGTVEFSSSDGAATLPANYTYTAANAGVQTFSATLNTPGTQSLTATDTVNSSITGSQTGITVNPAGLPVVSFRVTGFPTPTTAGTAETITVTALDANGNVAPRYSGTISFSSSDAKAGLPANYTFTNADQGVHTFTVTLKTAGTQSITATDTTTSSISGTESGITITPAAASQFILSAPSSATKGDAFSVTLTVEDAYGNVVTGYTGTVSFTSSDSTAVLPANYTFKASDAGVHTFVSGVTMKKKGSQTLTVTDTGNSALTATDSITVN